MEWKAATPAGTARDSRPRRSLRRGGSSRALDARPPGTEYAVKNRFWRRSEIINYVVWRILLCVVLHGEFYLTPFLEVHLKTQFYAGTCKELLNLSRDLVSL